MMKTQRIALFAMTAALAALSATAATTTLRLDTRTGVRTAADTEEIAYSTAWNGTGACSITLDGTPLLSNAAGTGNYAWNASAASTGLHTLTFDDGVETMTTRFAVGIDVGNVPSDGGAFTLPDATEGEAYTAQLALSSGAAATWRMGSSGRYAETAGTASSFNAASGVAQGWHADDACWELELPFDFPFFGATYTHCYVSDNGTISFDEPFSQYSVNESDFLSHAMIAPMWADLYNSSMDVYIGSAADQISIRWNSTYWSSSSAVNFSATLYPDGRIVLSYGAGNARGGFIGISAGEGGTSFVSGRSESGSMANAADIVFQPVDDTLPAGLSLAADGTISGTPERRGTYDFAVVATEAGSGTETLATATLVVRESPIPEVGRILRRTGPVLPGSRCILVADIHGDRETMRYRWTLDGEEVGDGPTLDIPALGAEDFGEYVLELENAYGTATSEAYVLAPAPAGVPVGWGADGHGRTTAPEGLTGLAQVASGMNFNLGLSTNGTVTAWGYNGHGACDVPAGLSDVAFVAAGGYQSQGAGFAVKRDGTVAAWGRPMETGTYWDDWAHYDDDTDTYTGDWITYTNGWDTVSTMPAGLSDVVKVAVGGECAIALHADGTVTAWGRAEIDESWEDQWNEVEDYWESVCVVTTNDVYAAPADLSDVVDVAAGSAFLMALRADGTVAVWNDGETWYGETKVPAGLSDVVAIAAGKGYNRTCFALRADGTIVKWGDRDNVFGLGRKTAAGAVAIDAGQYHLMAIDAEGNVSVWQDWNNYDVCDVPDVVENALAIAAGGYHCTAIVSDSDGDSISDAEEIAYGRDPLVWEEWRRSTVSGTVATEFGPVEGALVQFFDGSGNIHGARTDADGAYAVSGLLAASYTVKVEAPGAVDVWYDSIVAGSDETPTAYAVPGNTVVSGFDFLLDPGQGPAEAGVVCLEPDGGEDGGLVEVALPDGAVAYLDMWPTEMDADGTIDLGEVGSVASGAASHTVTLKLPGAGAAVPSPVGAEGCEGARMPVEVAVDGPRGSLTIETAPAGATVYVDYADTPFGVTPLSVDNLLAGSHTILLHKDGYLRPRPVVAWVGGEEPTEVAVPLHTAAETNEMTVAVSCVLPDQEIYLDYLPTGEVAPATVGGMDPASHAGELWHSASHTILLKHPMVRPWAPRYVPEPVYDAGTDSWSYDSALEIDGPQLYDDSDGDGVRNDIAIAEGRNPFYALEEALDATELVWTTGGDRKWRAVKTDAVPTGGYGLSGAIGNGETTWVETTVKGAGTLSFKWKTSCRPRVDMILLTVDGANKERLFGESADWTAMSVEVAEVAEHVLRWTFSRGASGSAGENSAWLDEVTWTPNAAANARTLTVASRYAACDPAPGDHALSWGDEVAATAAAYSNGQERATCTGWTGTGSVPASGAGVAATFAVEADSTLTWSWETEFRLDLATSGSGTLSRESGWFAEGAMAIVTAMPGLYQRFVRWEGDTEDCRMTGATIRAPMTRGRSLRAVFEPDTCMLAVDNAHGAASPTNGVHEIAMGTEISAWSTNFVEQGRTQFVCMGWTGTGSVPASGEGTNTVFTLLEDSSLAWAWQTNHLVRVRVEGAGSVDFTEGWITEGSNLVVTATAGAAYVSAVWTGDIEGATPDGLRITIPVDGPKDIAIAFEALGIGRALEQEGRAWTTGTTGAPWMPVADGAHDGVDACRSGAVDSGDYGESILSATFSGPGNLSFWWRLGDTEAACGIDLNIDGQDVGVWLYGETGWESRTVALDEGEHVVEWIFWSDGADPDAAGWLDEVAFSGGGESQTATQTTPVPVPYAWLEGYGLGDGTEAGYETAAKAMASNGVNRVWQCHVVGLDPTDETAAFQTTIRMENGQPVIATDPERPDWTPAAWYHIDGKTNLDDAWAPKTSAHRFFRVRVVVPEE